MAYEYPVELSAMFEGHGEPSLQELLDGSARLSRRSLLELSKNAPMFIFNGADDAFVPQADTLIFEGRPNTEAHLLPGAGHCCVSKANETMQTINDWLKGMGGKG
jgi:esterase FrsA